MQKVFYQKYLIGILKKKKSDKLEREVKNLREQ